jgi:hypothetical protein
MSRVFVTTGEITGNQSTLKIRNRFLKIKVERGPAVCRWHITIEVGKNGGNLATNVL